MKKVMMLRAAILAAALSIPMATTTSAQPPWVVIGGGLVNVQIGTINVETGDILSFNEVQVNVNAAAQIAANVCGVAVAVLAEQIAAGSPVECTTEGDQIARFVNIN